MIVIIIIIAILIIVVGVVMILIPSNVEVKNGVVKPKSTTTSSVNPIKSKNTKPLNMLLYVQPPLVAAAIPRKKQVILRGRR